MTLITTVSIRVRARRTASHAQAPGGASNAEQLDKLETLSKQLNLTPEQKDKLQPTRRILRGVRVHVSRSFCLWTGLGQAHPSPVGDSAQKKGPRPGIEPFPERAA